MKRMIVGLLALCMVLVAAGCNNGPAIPPITVEGDHFSITPQEFINGWNAAVEAERNTAQDKGMADLLAMPDFVKSGDKIKMGEHLSIKMMTSGDYLKDISIYCNRAAPYAEIYTFAFMTGAIPFYLNPETTIEFGYITDNPGRNVYDGQIRYFYTAGDFGVELFAVSIRSDSSASK